MDTKRAKLGLPHVFAQGNPLQLHLCPVKLHHPGLAFAHRQQLASSLRPCSGRALSHIVVVQCNIQQCVLLNLLWTALQRSIAKSIPYVETLMPAAQQYEASVSGIQQSSLQPTIQSQ